ncbi:RibD family protein [Sulfobacillus harzensis]|uniref:RibD family protein n=1 Tax=Sulfobacillus harzensis TaxID=2729629 RepID=A0A7Y0L3N9_9FIRM|nr:RibD family protein [Sulfobacillus harzensis]NMP22703.1 RibD family protein [Sulfobacillus harzensis]
MPRPEVIIIMGASVDGRITTAPGRNVTEWIAEGLMESHDHIHHLADNLDCDGLMSGSESVLIWGSHPIRLPSPGYWPKKSKAYIVVDGRGRIQWAHTEGLIVVTRETVAPEYRAQLAEKHIDAIFAGHGRHVDLRLALAQLYRRGFRRLALTGGGRINAAFLQEGLVDQVSVVWNPLLVGGHNTPTIYDRPNITDIHDIIRLQLIRSERLDGQSVWAHYRVTTAPAAAPL